MRAVPVLILLVVAASGCVTPPAQPTELPEVLADDYDVLWEATVRTVERHFDLFVQRKDQGYLVSTYKRGEPLPGGLKRDAQTGYDAAEEFLHVVRRRLTARVLEQEQGVYVVRLEVIRERQAYVPPPDAQESSYNLYDHRRTALDDAADQRVTVTWQRLGRDKFLERKLLREIRDYVGRNSVKRSK